MSLFCSGRILAPLFAVAVLGPAAPAAAQQRELQAIGSELGAISLKLANLGGEFGDAQAIQTPRNFATRMTDAEILFLLADYPRASLVLFDLVDDAANAKEPLYAKALFYLAESQFQMRNDIAARTYFKRVVERRDNENLAMAIRRLIEVADRTNVWAGLDGQVAVLREKGELPASVAYINAKSLLRQGRLDAVPQAVAEIPETNLLAAKGRYLVAVAKLQSGSPEEARQLFAELTGIPDSYEDAKTLRELAKIDQARIYLDLGQLSAALDAYASVDHDSPYFEDALYETTWTHVRSADGAAGQAAQAAEYLRALRALELLLLSETSTTLAPEARILLGNIQLRLQRYDDATAAFAEVVERYEPVRAELAALAVGVKDPVAYYDEIAVRSRTGGGLLPPLAIKWASEQRQLKQALGVVKSLDEAEGWLKESQQVANRLSQTLDSEQRLQFFPALHQAQARVLEIENTLVALSYRLLAVERDLIGKQVDPSQVDALREITAERQRLEPEFRKLPQRKEDYEGRLKGTKARLDQLEKQDFRLRWEVEEIRRGVEAMRSWLAGNRATLKPGEADDVHSRLTLAEREARALDETQKQVDEEIAQAKSSLTIGSPQEERELETRRDYVATLDKERAILSAAAASLTGEKQSRYAQIVAQRDLLSRCHADLAGFRDHLGRMVNDEAYDIRARLGKEQETLAQQAAAVASARADAQRVVGEIGIGALRGVERSFRSIVLRGDVGVIDVAWALKEAKTHEISRHVSDEKKEMAVLDSDFEGVMQE